MTRPCYDQTQVRWGRCLYWFADIWQPVITVSWDFPAKLQVPHSHPLTPFAQDWKSRKIEKSVLLPWFARLSLAAETLVSVFLSPTPWSVLLVAPALPAKCKLVNSTWWSTWLRKHRKNCECCPGHRSLSDCKSLTLNVMIQVSQFVSKSHRSTVSTDGLYLKSINKQQS